MQVAREDRRGRRDERGWLAKRSRKQVELDTQVQRRCVRVEKGKSEMHRFDEIPKRPGLECARVLLAGRLVELVSKSLKHCMRALSL